MATRRYKLNGEIYNIPEDIVESFEADNPSATQAYKDESGIYDIPISERDGFLKAFSGATLLNDDEDEPAAQVAADKETAPVPEYNPHDFSPEAFSRETAQAMGLPERKPDDVKVPEAPEGQQAVSSVEEPQEPFADMAMRMGLPNWPSVAKKESEKKDYRPIADSYKSTVAGLRYATGEVQNMIESALGGDTQENYRKVLAAYDKLTGSEQYNAILQEYAGKIADTPKKDWKRRKQIRDQYMTKLKGSTSRLALGRILDNVLRVNGNLDNMRILLSVQFAEPTIGDRRKEMAEEAMRGIPEPETFLDKAGAMVATLAPYAVGLGVSLAGLPEIGAVISKVTTAGLVGGAAGEAGLTARDYLDNKAAQAKARAEVTGEELEERDYNKETAQVRGVMASTAAIEALVMTFGLGRFTSRLSRGAARVFEGDVAAALKAGGKEAANKELERALLESYKRNRIPGTAEFLRRQARQTVLDAATAGGTRAIGDVLQTAVPIIYENPEDYPTLNNYLAAAGKGFTNGAIMGAFLGAETAAGKAIRLRSVRAPYVNNNGEVRFVVMTDGKGVAMCEQIGDYDAKTGTIKVSIGDNVVDMPAQSIIGRYSIPLSEFEANRSQWYSDAAYEAGHRMITAGSGSGEGSGGAVPPVQGGGEAPQSFIPKSPIQVKLNFEAARDAVRKAFGKDSITREEADQLTGPDREIADNYLEAEAGYRGMIDAARENIDAQIQIANNEIDARTNEQGFVQGGTTTTGKQVYVVGGNVVLAPDGSIDYIKSDKSIVLLDVETGVKEMTDVHMLESVSAPISAEVEKTTAAEQIRNMVAERDAAKIDGKLDFSVNSVVTVLGGEDGMTPEQYTITGDNGDGTVNVVGPDGKAAMSNKQILQEGADKYQQYLLDQAKAERDAAEREADGRAAVENLTLSVGDEVSFPDGTVGQITSSPDADGRMQIDVILPDGGTRVWNLTAEEIKARMSVPENAGNVPNSTGSVPKEPASVPNPTENSGIITGEEATKEVQLYGTRIREWLSGDNLQKAEGMSREEIFEQFGNTPEPIAYVPIKYLSVFGDDVRDNRIYCGKGYFIDHALNHHPEVTMSEYDLIQSVLSEPDAIKRTSPKTIAFTKRIGKGYAALLQFSEEDGKIIYHKSLFWRDKGMPYANKPDIEVKPLVGGRSTISPNEESLAGRLLSALNGSSANIGNFLITSKEIEELKAQEDRIVYKKPSGINSEGHLAKDFESLPDLVPAQPDGSSASKVTQSSSNSNSLVDFRGNPLPLRSKKLKDGTTVQVVDGDRLAADDPEAWAAWNEAQPVKAVDTRRQLENLLKENADKIARQQDRVEKLRGKTSQAAVEDALDVLKGLEDYGAELKSVLAKYSTQQDGTATIGGEQRAEAAAQANAQAAAGFPAIQARFAGSNKAEGLADEITLANGETIPGKYMLVEADAVTASHNPAEGFTMSEGFPVDENGKTVNDRDYRNDEGAQRAVTEKAKDYDQRAFSPAPPIVSADGVVLSGNDRTMAGQLAAQNGTDGKYMDYITRYGQKYGFTPEQIAQFSHPRIVFVPDEAMDYTAQNFAKFNADYTKSQNRTEKAVKAGKVISPEALSRIATEIGMYDDINAVYANPLAVENILRTMVEDGLIGREQLEAMRDGERLSGTGMDIVESALVGSVLEEEAVRIVMSDPSMRKAVVSAIGQITANGALTPEYNLKSEMTDAIALVKRAKENGIKVGETVQDYIRQLDLFGDKPVTEATVQLMADILNSRKTSDLKKMLSLYNGRAVNASEGVGNIFGEGQAPETKEDILRDLLNHFGYGTRTTDAAELRQGAETPGAAGENGREAAAEVASPSGQLRTGEGGERAGREAESAIEAARADVEPEPTEAQKKAGNYKMGHVTIDGLNISLENPKGSVRKGTDRNGKAWEIEMKNDYGYIRSTKGVDGDHIDVFLSDTPEQGNVYVVDQVNPDGTFDEHKVMYGFNSPEEAKAAYLSNYEEGWQGLGNITPVSREEFRKWIESSTRKTKPFAEYAGIKPLQNETGSGIMPEIGPFGPVFRQYKGNAQDAIARLIQEKSGEAVAALNHPSVGDIDLVWGEEGTGKSDGFGLAKLVKYHPEIVGNLQGIINEMSEVSRSANRVNLESDKYKAAVRLTWDERRKTWLLTAFEKQNSALDNTTDTGETPRGEQNDTATLQNTVSTDKGSEISEFTKEQFEKTKKDAGEYADRLTVSSSSTGDEVEENFIQKYDLDGKPSGVTRVDMFDSPIESNPTWYTIDGSDVDSPMADQNRWQQAFDEYRKAYPKTTGTDALESGISFRTFDEARKFREWADGRESSGDLFAEPTPEQSSVMKDLMGMTDEQVKMEVKRAEVEKYLDGIKGGADVMVSTSANVLSELKKIGTDAKLLSQVESALKNDTVLNFLLPSGKIVVLSDNVASKDEARRKFVHERQHLITGRNVPQFMQDLGWEGLTGILHKLAAVRDEKGNIIEENNAYDYDDSGNRTDNWTLANEVISYAMEVAYSVEPEQLADALRNYGVNSDEIINFIKNINDEQYNDGVLRQSRDTGRAFAYVHEVEKGSGGQDGRAAQGQSGQVSPSRHRPRGGRTGSAGAEQGRVSAGRKIDDYGEKIEGARKFALQEIAKRLDSVTEKSLAENPLAKVFKKPDFARLAKDGTIRDIDAQVGEAICAQIQSKPKAGTKKDRYYKWNHGESKVETWAKETAKTIQMLNDFLKGDDARKDELIKWMAEERYVNREADEAEAEKRRILNPGKDIPTAYTINPYWFAFHVLQNMGYTPEEGVKTKIPVITRYYSYYSIKDANGNTIETYNTRTSPEEIAQDVANMVKFADGKPIDIPLKWIGFKSTRHRQAETPTSFDVVYMKNARTVKRESFETREEADRRAAELPKDAGAQVYPEYDFIPTDYVLYVKDPMNGENIELPGLKFDTRDEAKAYGLDGENLESIRSGINEANAKAKNAASSGPKERLSIAMTFGNGWGYSIIYSGPAARAYAEESGSAAMVPVRTFKTRKEAEEYLSAHRDELTAHFDALEEQRKNFVYFDADHSRKGVDYRKGKDVTPEDLATAFGFRGVQFGNWTNDADRQNALNQAYDAMMDLSEVTGLSPKALSLNGELGIAFGARGSGGFAAHYEPDHIVINLTKTQGAGSLAHEWLHAIDNYFARHNGDAFGMVTAKDVQAGLRPELQEALSDLMREVHKTGYYQRSKRKSDYYGREYEVMARLFAEYVNDKLNAEGKNNSFLSRGIDESRYEAIKEIGYAFYRMLHKDDIDRDGVVIPLKSYEDWKAAEGDKALGDFPYPTKAETAQLAPAIERFFKTIQEKAGDNGNILLFAKHGDNTNNMGFISKLFKKQSKDGQSREDHQRVIRQIEREYASLLGPLQQAGEQGGGDKASELAARSARNWQDERLLEGKARQDETWHDDADDFLLNKYGGMIARGDEADVYTDDTESKVVKSKRISYPTIREALDAIDIHNSMFPETRLDIVGFGRSMDGDLRILLSQDRIDIARAATDKEIADFIADRGLEKEEGTEFTYRNGDILVSDLHKGNVVIDKESGKTVCIDCKAAFSPVPNGDIEATGPETEVLFSKRTKPAPKKTAKGYKLMRLGEDGKLYPLFIDSKAEGLELGEWYDADSPKIADLEKLPVGFYYKIGQDGKVLLKQEGKPSKAEVEQVKTGERWIGISEYDNGERNYQNVGINGAGAVSTYAMRPGWHLGSMPVMTQIGKGPERNLRDDSFVWAEVEFPVDRFDEYEKEKMQRSTKDIATHIPEDGAYIKGTSSFVTKGMDWYIAGAIRPVRILGDLEARRIIDNYNEETESALPYDYPRESGRIFNERTMRLEEPDEHDVNGERNVLFAKQNRSEAEDAEYMQAVEAGDTEKAREVMLHSDSFKKWFGDWEKTENIKSGINALSRLAAGEEEVNNAMSRPDLKQFGGDENITFIYGNAGDAKRNFKGGYGIVHIGAKHGTDAIFKAIEIIASGKVDRYVPGNKTVVLTDGAYETIVALTWNGDTKSWLFNGWEKKENAGSNSEVSTQSVPTQINPTFSREDLGAALTEAKIQELLESANNSSKIVDEDGRPLVVYHNTNSEFSIFDNSKIGSNTDYGAFGFGFYFTPDSRQFGHYGRIKMPLYLDLKNPLTDVDEIKSIQRQARKEITGNEYGNSGKEVSERISDIAQKRGYDGIWFNDGYSEEIVAFNPSRIKSAEPVTYDDNGEVIPLSERFDDSNPSILFAKVNSNQKKAANQTIISDADVAAEDAVLFSMSRNTRNVIAKWVDKYLMVQKGETGISTAYGEEPQKFVASIVKFIEDAFDSPTEQLAYAKWFCNGSVMLGNEDTDKVRQAVAVARAHKVDPLSYSSPMEIINAWPAEIKEAATNPDNVSTLHKAKEFPTSGIAIYDVDDTEESRLNMRKIINTHFGKNCSPWCLLQGDGEGNLSGYSAQYWEHYSAYPKQVAFKDGKLLAFSANNSSERVWWDRQDRRHDGIPVIGRIKGDALGRSADMIFSAETGDIIGYENIHRGERGKGVYDYWRTIDDTEPSSHSEYDEQGLGIGVHYDDWISTGNRYSVVTYGRPGIIAERKEYYPTGQLKTVDQNDDSGKLLEKKTYYPSGRKQQIVTYDADGDVYETTDYYRSGKVESEMVQKRGSGTTYAMGLMLSRVNYDTRGEVSEAYRTIYNDGTRRNVLSRTEKFGDTQDRRITIKPFEGTEVFERGGRSRMVVRFDHLKDGYIARESYEVLFGDVKHNTEYLRSSHSVIPEREEFETYHTFGNYAVSWRQGEREQTINAGETPFVERKVREHGEVTESREFVDLSAVPDVKKIFLDYEREYNDIEMNPEDLEYTNSDQVMFAKTSLPGVSHTGGLPDIESKESLVERTYRDDGSFSFTGKNKIESVKDVAFIFKQLETAAVENSFVVFVKGGIPTILHTGMGTVDSTFFDTDAVLAGYADFGADEIYMVHNHPSGSIQPSAADIKTLKSVMGQVGDIPVRGIIIDTLSGKYGVFTDEFANTMRDGAETGEEAPVQVKSFDKMVFAPDYVQSFDGAKMTDASKVAAYLSAHRLGDCSKIGGLLLNKHNQVNGNVVASSNVLDRGNAAEMARQMALAAVRANASNIVLFGDFATDEGALRTFRQSLNSYGAERIGLLDAVKIDGNHTRSLHEGTYLMDEGKKKPEMRQDLTTSSSNQVSTAKIGKIIESLKNLSGELQSRDSSYGLLTNLSDAIGAKSRADGASRYADFELANGNRLSIRISNHNANANNYDSNAPDSKISIVVKSGRRRNSFVGNNNVELTEYVYFKEQLDGEKMSKIASSLADALKTGVYVDKTGIAKVNRSGAHNGALRDSGQKDFYDILNEASEEDRRAIVDEAMKNGLDFRKATEDVMFAKQGNIGYFAENATMRADEARNEMVEKLRSISGKMSSLRKAAAAQRQYDRETVASVVSLANSLLGDAEISELRRSEIKRLLAIVRDANGKQDISNGVEDLVDLTLKIQLNEYEGALEKALKVRATKINTKGVEVQGDLDIRGQRVKDILKKSMDLDDETLDNKIADLQQEIFEAGADAPEEMYDELCAYNIAKEYRDTILASEESEADVKESIRRARMEHRSGRIDFKEMRQRIEAANETIRNIKIDRVEAYNNLLSSLGENMSESIARKRAFVEQQQKRADAIYHMANSDRNGDDFTEQEPKNNILVINPASRFLLQPLATFDQMLRGLGKYGDQGRGYLWNYFVRGYVNNAEREYRKVKADTDILDKKVQEVFGNKKMLWSDLYNVERSMPTMEVMYWDNGKMRPHTLTQGNLMYIYMVNKMDDGRMKLRNMGIMEEDVETIKDFLDPRVVALADWLQEDFFKGLRSGYDEVYKRMFGAPMPVVENYVPIRIFRKGRAREVDLNAPDVDGSTPSEITGSIIKRTKNTLPLDILGTDAFDLVIDHVQSMEHWAAFGEYIRDLNTLLSYKKFRNWLESMSGIYGKGPEVFDTFRKCAQITVGTYHPKSGTADKALVNLAKGVSMAKVSFRLNTAIKQLLSFPAFLADANVKYLAKALATPATSWNWCLDNVPLFEKRWKSRQLGDTRLMNTDSDWNFRRSKLYNGIQRIGMMPNVAIDALTICAGAKAVYDTRRAKYLKDGYTEDAADRRAKEDASIVYNSSQQSSEGPFVSAIQMDKTLAAVALSLFRNASMSYTRNGTNAARDLKHRAEEGFKERAKEFQKKQMIRDGVSEEDAGEAAKRNVGSAGWRDTITMVINYYVLPALWILGGFQFYLLLGADDDDKEKMLKDALLKALIGGPIEGLAGGNLLSEMAFNAVTGEKVLQGNHYLMPLLSDLSSAIELTDKDKVAAANEFVNIAIQMGLGANPKTLTDVGAAVYDACKGDLGLVKETMLFLLRVMQVPQSQIRDLYFDEVDMKGDELMDLTIKELADRYAKYRLVREAPLTGWWAYSDEEREKRIEAYRKSFLKQAEEKKRIRGNDLDKAWYEYVDNDYKEIKTKVSDLRHKQKEAEQEGDSQSALEFQEQISELQESDEFKEYEEVEGIMKSMNELREGLKDINPASKKDTSRKIRKLKEDFIEKINKSKQD